MKIKIGDDRCLTSSPLYVYIYNGMLLHERHKLLNLYFQINRIRDSIGMVTRAGDNHED